MRTLLHVLDILLAIYLGILLANMVVYWLIGFGAINADRPAIAALRGWLAYASEPAVRPFQLIMPRLAELGATQLVPIFILAIVRYAIVIYIVPMVH